MYTMWNIYIFGLTLILLNYTSATLFTADAERDVRSFINASMNCHHIPGMTIAVVKDNQVWTNGYGTADFSTGKQVDGQSIFNIGSVTKSFTATLLAILLKEHGYVWSTKVKDVLGQDYEFVDSYRTEELTFKDLLSHRTGLARLDSGLMSGNPKSITRSQLCKKLKFLPSKMSIRDGFLYNNYMYMLLGHVTEILGKDTWENLVMSKIIRPLGMNSTRILKVPEDIMEADIAKPYIYANDTFQNGTQKIYELHPAEPAGAILSSASDMAKWIKFNLNLGRTETGTQLLDRELMEGMHWPTTTFSSQSAIKYRFLTSPKYPVDEVQIGYGYAWFLSAYRGYKNVWHSGGLHSYITLIWMFPDAGVGIYASVNGPCFKRLSSDHLYASFYYLSDHLLGLQPWLNETTACTFPEPWANETAKESRDPEQPIDVDNLSEFAGSYANNLLPTIEVFVEATTVRLNSNRQEGILHPSSEKDRFLWEITYPWEFAVSATDANNETTYTNVTFLRNDKTNSVYALTMGFEVNVTYRKSLSVLSRSNVNDSVILSVVIGIILAIFGLSL